MADEQVVASRVLFGHCSHAPADLDKHKCLGRFQRFYIGPVGRGRNKKPNGVIWLDEWVECICLCHIPEDERPKPKKRAARKKAVKRTSTSAKKKTAKKAATPKEK